MNSRINDENQTWQLIYPVATDAVVILEVFSKKTAATPNEVLTTCKRRLAKEGVGCWRTG